ncbi:hypothetical protein A2U01_0107580, partial [Trifolium medium]|nr:hypothetical protein [Trifolium medium]
ICPLLLFRISGSGPQRLLTRKSSLLIRRLRPVILLRLRIASATTIASTVATTGTTVFAVVDREGR